MCIHTKLVHSSSYNRKSIKIFLKSGPKIISDEKLENINLINVEGSCGLVELFLYTKRMQQIVLLHKVILPRFQDNKRHSLQTLLWFSYNFRMVQRIAF